MLGAAVLSLVPLLGAGFREQSYAVKGTLRCGRAPANAARLLLYDLELRRPPQPSAPGKRGGGGAVQGADWSSACWTRAGRRRTGASTSAPASPSSGPSSPASASSTTAPRTPPLASPPLFYSELAWPELGSVC